MNQPSLIHFAELSQKVIGITGNAGAGKTTFAHYISHYYNNQIPVYSIDFRFIGDSNYRSNLLKSKQNNSIQQYIDACNQFNWWDWEAIYKDITCLLEGKEVVIEKAYDRLTGKIENEIILKPWKKIIIEGALLGPMMILNLIDSILFIKRDVEERFNALIDKDKYRRTFKESISRFLITEYSEETYYQNYLSIANINNFATYYKGTLEYKDINKEFNKFDKELNHNFIPLSI